MFFSDKLLPEIKYGKIDNSTEFVVTPFKEETHQKMNKKEPSSSVELDGSNKLEKTPTQNSLYERLYNKGATQSHSSLKNSTHVNDIIDSTTLDNVSEKSTSVDDSSESEATYDDQPKPTKNAESSRIARNNYRRRSQMRLDSQVDLFDTLLAELKNQDRKTFKFRVIPRTWSNSQMCDIYIAKNILPKKLDENGICILSCDSVNENEDRITKEYYVNLKQVNGSSFTSSRMYPTIELNDILMAKLKISKFGRVTLSNKKTVLNFFEKIELIPTMAMDTERKKEALEDFKRMLIKCARSTPLLINQEQIFKLCHENVLVTVKIFPESFRYCLCDTEILRENKIFISENNKELSSILKAADEISSPKSVRPTFIRTNEFDAITENCVRNISINNCLNQNNHFRKLNNYLITGK